MSPPFNRVFCLGYLKGGFLKDFLGAFVWVGGPDERMSIIWGVPTGLQKKVLLVSKNKVHSSLQVRKQFVALHPTITLTCIAWRGYPVFTLLPTSLREPTGVGSLMIKVEAGNSLELLLLNNTTVHIWPIVHSICRKNMVTTIPIGGRVAQPTQSLVIVQYKFGYPY